MSKSRKRAKQQEKLASKPFVSKMDSVPEHTQDQRPLPTDQLLLDGISNGSYAGADRTSDVNSVAASDPSIGQPLAPAAAYQLSTEVVNQIVAPLPAAMVPVQPELTMQQVQAQIAQQIDEMSTQIIEINAQMKLMNVQNFQMHAQFAQLRREQRCLCCIS
jgi:hypothetical protein